MEVRVRVRVRPPRATLRYACEIVSNPIIMKLYCPSGLGLGLGLWVRG